MTNGIPEQPRGEDLALAPLDRERPGVSVTPLRATIVYLVFGFGALFVSDVLLLRYFSDPFLQRVQTFKGVVEVLLTGGLIFGLTYASRGSLRRHTAEIRRHHRELQILHRILRHNFRNHLTVLRGRSEQLRERLGDETQAELCDDILDAIDEIIRFTEQAQAIRKTTTEHGQTTVDLADAVPSLLASHELVTDDVRVETTLPDAARVTVSTQFDSALAELVSNAIEHRESGRPAVAVTVDPDAGPDGMTRVEVADDGPGIPSYVERVLTEGERDDLVHLDGMGLWFVYLTVVESGGEFSIENGEDGARVRIHVPDADRPRRPTGAWSPFGAAISRLRGAVGRQDTTSRP